MRGYLYYEVMLRGYEKARVEALAIVSGAHPATHDKRRLTRRR